MQNSFEIRRPAESNSMNSMTLGKKIAFGFGGLIAIAALLGGLAMLSMKSVQTSAGKLAAEYAPQCQIASQMDDALGEAQLAVRTYGLTASRADLEAARKGLADVHEAERAARQLAQAHPEMVLLRDHLARLGPVLTHYEALINQTETRNGDMLANRDLLNSSAAGFTSHLEKLIAAQNATFEKQFEAFDAFTDVSKLKEYRLRLMLATTIRDQGDAARVAAFKAQALHDPELLEGGLKNFDEMDKTFQRLSPLLRVKDELADFKVVETDAHTYRDTMLRIKSDLLGLADLSRKRQSAAVQVQAAVDEIRSAGMTRTVEAANDSTQRLAKASWTMGIGLGLALMIGIGIAAVIIRGATGVLTSVSAALGAGSDQVASAAAQVSASSQSLAEGASEQAASLEQTGASLEEMSSMTQQNMQNAIQVNELAREALVAADGGATDMRAMTSAMNELKVSGDEVGKIIKTIDEIAFQTNLLALNAAVEAARAGEAGLGFAVVADEVRNLARRAAQAAKETSTKIADTIVKTSQGVTISEKVSGRFSNILSKMRQVDELAGQVANASKEQSQGIEQVSTAIAQLDSVTQSNAASSEESASAAEELNAQAEALQTAVAKLMRLVGAPAASREANPAPAHPVAKKSARHAASPMMPAIRGSGQRNGNGHGHGRVEAMN